MIFETAQPRDRPYDQGHRRVFFRASMVWLRSSFVYNRRCDAHNYAFLNSNKWYEDGDPTIVAVRFATWGLTMPNLPTRVVLFLSSYTPLFLIMAVRYSSAHRYFALEMVLLAAVSVSLLFIYLNRSSTLAVDRAVVEKISGKDTEAMSYIVTYLIPFLDIKLDELSSSVSLLLLFFVVGVLYVNSNLIYINPTLNLLRYHLFEIELEGGKTSALLSRRGFIERGTSIPVVSLGEQILLEIPEAS